MSFGGSAGGSSSIGGSIDVALNNPLDGQVLAYNGGLAKWQNHIAVGGNGSISPVKVFVYQKNGNSTAVDNNGNVISTASTSALHNTTVIQAAIDSLAADTATFAAGGAVMLDTGAWDISAPLNLKYGVSLCGQLGSWHDDWIDSNLFGTVLRPSSAVGSGAAVQCGTAASGSRLATNPHGSWITSLAIDGSNNSVGSGINWLDCSYSRTQNVFIRNFTGGSGVRFTGNVVQNGGPTTGSSLDNVVYDCTISNCAYGVKVDGVASTDGAIRDCRIMTAGIHSIDIACGGWQVSGGHFTAGGNAPHLNINAGLFICYGSYFDSGTNYIGIIGSSCGVITNCLFEPSTDITANAAVQLSYGKTIFSDNTFMIQNNTSAALKGAVEIVTGTTTGLVRNNVVRNLGGHTVTPVVNSSGSAWADTNTSSMYVGENLLWAS